MFKNFLVKLLHPLTGLILLFAAVLTLSLIQTMRETDNVDAERSQMAAAAALRAQIKQIVMIADDNGIWDDAAIAVYRNIGKTDFFWSSWGASTTDGQNYESVAVIDNEHRTLLAFERGKAVPVDISASLGAPLRALLAKVDQTHQPSGGIAQTANGLVVIGVSNVLPTSRNLDQIVPKSGPFRVVFIRHFSADLSAAMSESIGLHGAAFNKAGDDRLSIPVEDASGSVVASLSWENAHPGAMALGRALPLIIGAALLHIFLAFLIASRGLKSVRLLAKQALVDSLSNLPNRRALRREMALRLKRGENIALAMIDLDGFKAINDNYGHAVGDQLIKNTANILSEIITKGSLVARLGGDEFAVMTTGADAVAKAEKVGTQILSRLSAPFHIGERTVVVGASIGLAGNGPDGFEADELLRRADVAMYAAKRSGKMRFAWYDALLDQKQATAHLIELELRAAIETEDFEILYQPVFGVHEARIAAVEALLRWRSPSRGVISPVEFIPVAEETGLIDQIGMIVLRRACVEGLVWPGVNVAVNVSAAQLRNPDFPAKVGAILAETGFPAHRLELEITETYLVYDPETAGRVLREVRALGVGVALDDFGTGYASIGFLRQFGFSKLKLDRSLVAEAGESEAARTVLQASIAVARALNMAVTAEGVETDAQADLMRVAGCDQLQGWLYSKAVDAQTISARISAASAPGLVRRG